MDDQMKVIFADVEKLTKEANLQMAKAGQLIEELERKNAPH
jgi:uncharacterized protein YoxC